MDLNHLAVFVRVAEHGSFTQAARELGVHRSAVSRQVAALEEDLGVRLLLRSTRRVQVTTAGRRLLRDVAPLLHDLDAAVHGLPERSEVPAGELRITAPADVGVWLLAPVLGELAARYPALHPVVHHSNRVVDLEREGYDVALRVSFGPLQDSALRVRRLGPIALRLYASPPYLEAHGTPATREDLADHVLVGFGSASTLGLPGSRRIVVDDMVLAVALVKQGAALALLPSFFVAEEVAAGALVPVLPAVSEQGGVLHAVFPSARELPPKVTAFRDAVLAFLQAHPLTAPSRASV